MNLFESLSFLQMYGGYHISKLILWSVTPFLFCLNFACHWTPYLIWCHLDSVNLDPQLLYNSCQTRSKIIPTSFSAYFAKLYAFFHPSFSFALWNVLSVSLGIPESSEPTSINFQLCLNSNLSSCGFMLNDAANKLLKCILVKEHFVKKCEEEWTSEESFDET